MHHLEKGKKKKDIQEIPHEYIPNPIPVIAQEW